MAPSGVAPDKADAVHKMTFGSSTLRLLLLLALASASHAETLRVMSFNVRLPVAADGANAWEQRRDLFVDTVREQAPDLMGTQELYFEQGQYIVEKLPEYRWFGLSRRGNHEDEHMGVFYRPDRLQLLDSGDFWLSNTPERAGSSSWGNPFPRMVTWGLFETAISHVRFLYYNTHFPYRAEDDEARRKAATLIVDRLALYDATLPIIVAGDFNSEPQGGAYAILTRLLKDAWLEAPSRIGPDATFHGFSGKPDRRIDWILLRAPWRVLSAQVDTRHDGTRYPSDHFPVSAVFELAP